IERAARLASAASGGNGGAIAPDVHALTDPAAFVAFGRSSLALYRELDAEWGGAIGLRTVRWLQVFDAPPGPLAPLDAAAVRELEPDAVLPLGGSARLVPDQGAVNPQRLAAVLAARAGQVATGVTMTGVRTDGGRIAGVRT